MVLVDTSVWSLALRRNLAVPTPGDRSLTLALEELVRRGQAQIIGVIRQELLSGIREEAKFRRVRDRLRAFEEPVLDVSDYEEAAEIHNQCRRRGVEGSAIDFLICAVAIRREWQIFTTHQDFRHYQKILPLKLYKSH